MENLVIAANYLEYIQALKEKKKVLFEVMSKEKLLDLAEYVDVSNNKMIDGWVDVAIELFDSEIQIVRPAISSVPVNYGFLKGLRLKNSKGYFVVDVKGKLKFYSFYLYYITKHYKPVVKRIPMKINFDFSESENLTFYDFLDKHLDCCGKLDYCLTLSVEDNPLKFTSGTLLNVKCNICGEEEFLSVKHETLHTDE